MLVNLIGGVALTAALGFFLGYFIRSRIGQTRLSSAERQARRVIEQAAREAESVKRDAVLEGREEALRHKQQVERETQAARSAQLAAERAFQEKEAAFNRRVELIEKKDRDLKRLEQDLGQREGAVTKRGQELDRKFHEQNLRLEKIAGMSADEARAELVASIESEARAEASRRVSE